MLTVSQVIPALRRVPATLPGLPALVLVCLSALGWTAVTQVLGAKIPVALSLLAAIAIVLFLVVIRSPDRALTLLIVSLPLVSFGVIEAGWSIRPAQIITAIILAAWVVGARVSWRQLPLRGWLALYVISILFSTMWALYQPPASDIVFSGQMAQRASALRPLAQLFTITLGAAILPIAVLSANTEYRLSAAVKTLLAVTAAVCLYALYQPFAVAFNLPLSDITWGVGLGNTGLTNYGETRYYSGIVTSFAPRATFAESLHLAAYVAGILPLCLACWLGQPSLPARWRRWPWRSLSLLLGLVLILTFSRSGWVAGVVGVFVVLMFAGRPRIWLAFAGGCLVAYPIFYLIARLPIFSESISAIELISARLAPAYLIADPRLIYYEILSNVAWAHPIFGVGLGHYAVIGASKMGMSVVLSAHSVWASHWVEGGFVGLAVLTGCAVALTGRLTRCLRQARGGMWFFPLLGLSAGIAAMSAQYFTWGDRFDPYFWFIIGLALVVGNFALKRPQVPVSTMT